MQRGYSTIVFCIWLFAGFFGNAQPAYQNAVLNELISFNEKMKSDRLLVSINDTIIADKTFRGKANDKFLIYSITKVFSGMAIGILIDDHLIDHPEVPVATFFNEWRNDSLKSKITIRHILQHTSGLFTQAGSRDIYAQPDFVQYALGSKLVTEPGLVYNYNNRAINIISGIVHKVTGGSLEALIRQKVFFPLGITDYEWRHDGAGNTWGMDGLWLAAKDLLKVGQLLSNYGLWEGKRILSERWCKLMYQVPLVNCYNGLYGYAMAIRSLPFQEVITISNSTIDLLRKNGLPVPLLNKLNLLAQSGGYNYNQLGQKLKELFTVNELEALTSFANRHLIPIYTISNGNFFIKHGGEYGLLLTAFPHRNKVLVRYLGEKWGRQQKTDGTGYKYFIDDELVTYLLKL